MTATVTIDRDLALRIVEDLHELEHRRPLPGPANRADLQLALDSGTLAASDTGPPSSVHDPQPCDGDDSDEPTVTIPLELARSLSAKSYLGHDEKVALNEQLIDAIAEVSR